MQDLKFERHKNSSSKNLNAFFLPIINSIFELRWRSRKKLKKKIISVDNMKNLPEEICFQDVGYFSLYLLKQQTSSHQQGCHCNMTLSLSSNCLFICPRKKSEWLKKKIAQFRRHIVSGVVRGNNTTHLSLTNINSVVLA